MEFLVIISYKARICSKSIGINIITGRRCEMLKQLSIFVENEIGSLRTVTSVLKTQYKY